MRRPVITLLTDFGSRDHYVGAMKGVLLGICPDAQLVDISHEITPYAIAEAAFTLAQTWTCFPEGTVHLAVVDPGVGSARRPILAEAGGRHLLAPAQGALKMAFHAGPGVGSARRPILAEAAGHHFVAPDNGLLTMLYDAAPVHKVREITASRYF